MVEASDEGETKKRKATTKVEVRVVSDEAHAVRFLNHNHQFDVKKSLQPGGYREKISQVSFEERAS